MGRYNLTESVVTGQAGHPALHQAADIAVNDLDTIVGSRGVYLDEDAFAGADDDARLTNAMSYAGAQSFPPFINLSNRSHTFTTARAIYDGFRLRGPGGPANPEKSSAAGAFNPCKVQVSTNGTWLYSNASTCFDIAIMGGIGFRGTSSTQFLGGSAVYWCGLIRDVAWSDFKSVLGSQATRLAMDGFLIDGFIELQNCYNGSVHIGGSDNNLFMGFTNLDANPAYQSAGGSVGQYHIWLDYMDKTVIGPIYCTGEQGYGCIRVTGPGYNTSVGGSQGGPNWVIGAKMEGHLAGRPSYGNLVRVEGGIVNFQNCWFGYGMSSPSSTGRSPQDAGIIHQTGGAVSVDGCTYDHATGVAESVPFLYSTGGIGRVNNMFVGAQGGTWSGLPRVTGSGVTADSTVTVV